VGNDQGVVHDNAVEFLCRTAKMGAIELQARSLQDERTAELILALQRQLERSDEDRRGLAEQRTTIEDQRDKARAELEQVRSAINEQFRVAKDRLGATAEARQAFLRELASAEVIVDAHGSVVQLDAVRDAGEFISAWLHSVDAKPEQEGDDERKERA